MRTDAFLEGRLQELWNNHFSDIVPLNKIEIKFGRRARKRLGSIGLKKNIDANSCSRILINGHFRALCVPDYVIDATIAHELCHYVHGFSSPLPQIYNHPHRNGIVQKELERRGLADIAHKEWHWLQHHWLDHIKQSEKQQAA